MRNKYLVQLVQNHETFCKQNNFVDAGELAKRNKSYFITFIKNSTIEELEYAYKIAHIFNISQEQCYNLKYSK